MQYLQKGGYQKNGLIRLSLAFTSIFLILFVGTNFAMFVSKLGLTPHSVASYYAGSESEFIPARTFGSMLEVAHMHLPMMALVVLMLTHLVIFVPFSKTAKVFIICLAFVSALADEGSGWLVRFVGPEWAILKISAFLCLQAVLIFLIGALGVFLWRARREEDGPNGRPPAPDVEMFSTVRSPSESER